jgi:trehalose 2-sulfotransferase
LSRTATRGKVDANRLSDPEPIRNWMDARLDFRHSVALRKSYIVACSYRCGSTFLCAQLWKTGLLGAPGEYLNIGEGRLLREVMMQRLQVDSPESYFVKLLACRTSRNGVFGMKVHFPHFESALNWYPPMLGALAPVVFIYLDRKDTLAQAVSMAKALQSDSWTSMDDASDAAFVYDEAFIAQCLRELQHQKVGWLRWFKANDIHPFVVQYEDVVADTAGVVRSIVELLGVAGDKPEQVSLPAIEKLADETNMEWLSRFREARDPWLELDGGYGGPAWGWES